MNDVSMLGRGMSEEVAAALRALAFVNELSDCLVEQAWAHLVGQGHPGCKALDDMSRAIDDINLSSLRGGDHALNERGAKTLGFDSFELFARFRREHPVLSDALGARPAMAGEGGVVAAVSFSEVVFANERGLHVCARASLTSGVSLGDSVLVVGRSGSAQVVAVGAVDHGNYQVGQKYSGPIEEIRYLPVSVIRRQEMDFRPEVLSVSDDVAAGMDYSEPVEVTAFRYGEYHDDVLPQVALRDGHHRTAAAIQTQRPYLPVEVKAINALGEKLNALICMSRAIEAGLDSEVFPSRERGA